MEIHVKGLLMVVSHDYIVFIDFTYIAASNTNVTN